MIRTLLIASCLSLAVASAAAQEPVAQESVGQQPAVQKPATQEPATQELPAQASPPTASAPAAAASPTLVGNAETGRQLTYTCQGCHGVTGYKNAYPNYHVPLIGGQAAPYLVNALTEYKQGTRKHPTMQVQAQSFSEQDIADIAAYLSGLK